MSCLNEHLARRANAEERCTGRFWEGRFKSQALLDEAGLLTAMAYVDLNPVRAGIAETPEESEFTSVYARIQALRSTPAHSAESPSAMRANKLFAFCDQVEPSAPALPITLLDYVQLIDWSGRSVRADNRGAIDAHAPPILERLKVDPDAWRSVLRIRGNIFGRAMGRVDRLRLHARALGHSRIQGLSKARRLFGAA